MNLSARRNSLKSRGAKKALPEIAKKERGYLKMRKTIALMLSLVLLAASFIMIPVASNAEPITMWTYFEKGNTVNIRSTPDTSSPNNIIAKLGYGEPVQVEFINSTGWGVLLWQKNGYVEAYIQARFLKEKKPKQRTQPVTPTKSPEEKEQEAEQKKLNNELKSEKEVESYYIAVRPSRVSSWVNFRVGPSKITSRITTFGQDKELIVVGETTNWYRARDPETNKIGYIHKNYATPIVKQAAQTAEAGKQTLGTLSVNGEFELTCELPEGYNLQVVNRRGASIVASVQSEDMTKPQLYLSIGYDETYGDVERMNDMTDEELAVLEQSFTEMNEVAISYRETGYGTKLLVAREIGSDTDFVDILAIYKGYFVEFNMTPSPSAANQTLTEEQIGMCIDFLTNVDFNPVQK